jgi:hypothetical protein
METFEVGLTDRAEGVRLDRTLAVVARFPGQLPWPGGGCARASSAGLDPARSACAASSTPVSTSNEPIDTIAGARLVRSDGSGFELRVRRLLDARLVLEIDRRSYEPGATVGAQLAVADLNSDGRAELVTSANTLDPALDELRVQTLSEDGKLRDVYRLPMPGGVRAVGICSGTSNGIAPIVAASSEALWIVR